MEEVEGKCGDISKSDKVFFSEEKQREKKLMIRFAINPFRMRNSNGEMVLEHFDLRQKPRLPRIKRQSRLELSSSVCLCFCLSVCLSVCLPFLYRMEKKTRS